MTVKPKQSDPNLSFFQTKRGRDFIENLTAYTFLSPAFLIIFVFSIFPVGFAFVVTLNKWRRFPGGWRGLDSYVDAVGNFAFVMFFWLALGAFIFGLYTLYKVFQEATHRREERSLALLIPAIAWSAAAGIFFNWFHNIMIIIIEVPARLRGTGASLQGFVNELGASFSFPEVVPLNNMLIVVFSAAIILTAGFIYLLKTERSQHYLTRFTLAGTALIAGAWLYYLTSVEMNEVVTAAQEAGESLPIWSQTLIVSAGAGLLALAYWLWQRTVDDQESNHFVIRLVAAVVAVTGAVFLIQQLPQTLAAADDDVRRGFSNTLWYSALSVPVQLSLGMLLAVLLFQKIRFKSFFRIVYFLPYITPFVATAVMFSLIFSSNEFSLVNQLIGFFGIEPQAWLVQPRGVFELLFGEGIPDWAKGPSQALVVIIIYNIWIYAGYSAVIFLAGLGNIPEDVYEAARIDGATWWQQFRHITIPLLSPVTFFLTLIATIGTLQAFTQIFLMRRIGAYDAVNTINLYIYDEITSSSPDYSYGSAMAFVLFGVIFILTIIQNRIAEKRVFYG